MMERSETGWGGGRVTELLGPLLHMLTSETGVLTRFNLCQDWVRLLLHLLNTELFRVTPLSTQVWLAAM